MSIFENFRLNLIKLNNVDYMVKILLVNLFLINLELLYLSNSKINNNYGFIIYCLLCGILSYHIDKKNMNDVTNMNLTKNNFKVSPINLQLICILFDSIYYYLDGVFYYFLVSLYFSCFCYILGISYYISYIMSILVFYFEISVNLINIIDCYCYFYNNKLFNQYDDVGEDDSGEDDSGEDDSGEDDSGEDDDLPLLVPFKVIDFLNNNIIKYPNLVEMFPNFNQINLMSKSNIIKILFAYIKELKLYYINNDGSYNKEYIIPDKELKELFDISETKSAYVYDNKINCKEFIEYVDKLYE